MMKIVTKVMSLSKASPQNLLRYLTTVGSGTTSVNLETQTRWMVNQTMVASLEASEEAIMRTFWEQ